MFDDILFLILKELQYDRKYLYSCLLVNKTWCKIAIPILWKDPWKYAFFKRSEKLFDTIISHLSNEAKENLRIQGINLSTSQQKPLFNYISFCRYLRLRELSSDIELTKMIVDSKDPKISTVKSEILILLIRNTRLTHLYHILPFCIGCQIFLIPEAEHCFSGLKFLRCNISDDMNIDEFLKGLSKISKSIENLDLYFETNKPENMTGIIKLIEAQKNLNEIIIESKELLCKVFEDSLIKHADTIQYLQVKIPIKKVFSSLVNLISLDMYLDHKFYMYDLEVVHLPALKILKVRYIYTAKNLVTLASIIEYSKENLMEISIIIYGNSSGDIQLIYQNCPNLRYLEVPFNNDCSSKLKDLLINCKHLNRLSIYITEKEKLDWDNLFEIIAKLSPTSLFKFAFYYENPKLESLKMFFDNWKGRHTMLLKKCFNSADRGLLKKYEAEGVVTFV